MLKFMARPSYGCVPVLWLLSQSHIRGLTFYGIRSAPFIYIDSMMLPSLLGLVVIQHQPTTCWAYAPLDKQLLT